MAIGDAVLFTTIAMVLSTFSISPVLDDQGKPEKVKAEFTRKLTRYALKRYRNIFVFEAVVVLVTRSHSVAGSLHGRPQRFL